MSGGWRGHRVGPQNRLSRWAQDAARAALSLLMAALAVLLVGIPPHSSPALTVPTVSVPSVSTPTVSVPSVSTPTISVPTLSTPAVSIPKPDPPRVTLPSPPPVHTPSVRRHLSRPCMFLRRAAVRLAAADRQGPYLGAEADRRAEAQARQDRPDPLTRAARGRRPPYTRVARCRVPSTPAELPPPRPREIGRVAREALSGPAQEAKLLSCHGQSFAVWCRA
jgi:hypothetical protein